MHSLKDTTRVLALAASTLFTHPGRAEPPTADPPPTSNPAASATDDIKLSRYTLPQADARQDNRRTVFTQFTQPTTGRYFSFNFQTMNPAGLDVDPSVKSSVYRPVARWLENRLAESGGTLSVATELGESVITIGRNDERHAKDFARVLTRHIWRERYAARSNDLHASPSDAEIQKALEHVSLLRVRYKDVPFGIMVYGCDDEARGHSFGTPQEIEDLNRLNAAQGIPAIKGPIRNRSQFLAEIANTPPKLMPDGSLFYSVAFNGHGMPGGQGMALDGRGSVTGRDIAAALRQHCERYRDMYAEAHRSGKSAYLSTYIFCCYSQDQMRNSNVPAGALRNDGSGAPAGDQWKDQMDLLSSLEELCNRHKLRAIAMSVGETMRPGFYQPGTAVPVLGVRAILRIGLERGGKATLGDLYDEVAPGHKGIGSNPTIFVPDRRRPLIFQIGQSSEMGSPNRTHLEHRVRTESDTRRDT